MIIAYTMRSDTAVNLEHFPQLGRPWRRVFNKSDIKIPATDSRVLKPVLLSCPYSSSKSHRLDVLDAHQTEHYQDWLFINSTCFRFRAIGKKAFFSEKVFIISPRLLKDLRGETGRSISAEDKATAREYIRHAIAPLPHPSSASQYLTLARYNSLEQLRSLTIHIKVPDDSHIFIRLNPSKFTKGPLPDEFLNLLRDIGLRVDQLQMDLQLDVNDSSVHYQDPMKSLVDIVYPLLRALSARRLKGRANA